MYYMWFIHLTTHQHRTALFTASLIGKEILFKFLPCQFGHAQ
jgi:hypothetical protein